METPTTPETNKHRHKPHSDAGIIAGVVLIFIGILWTLDIADIIRLSFRQLFKYIVPLGMVVCGVLLTVKNKLIKWIIFAACLLFLLIMMAVKGNISGDVHHSFSKNIDKKIEKSFYFDNDKDCKNISNTRAEFEVEVKENGIVDLEISAGAAELKSGKITTNYLDIYRDSELFKSIDNTGKNEIFLKAKTKHDIAIDFALNDHSIYNLSFEIGAVDADLDLSPYCVKKCDIEMGAANVDVKFGNNLSKIDVDIEMGAGNIILRIPKESGCVLDVESFLIDKTLSGFSKKDGKYYTENYQNVKNTISIKLEGAVSKFEITRY
jgi:hypothetical protein